jgi:hypothetical protein
MEVVGYTYDAAEHCPDCTRKYILDNYPKTAPIIGSLMAGDIELSDENIEDSEGNQLHPIFDTDEAGDSPSHCDDCGAFIDNAWNGDTVTYAIDRLGDYVTGAIEKRSFRGDSETLDTWMENLEWCGRDEYDDLVMDLYATLRRIEKEKAALLSDMYEEE